MQHHITTPATAWIGLLMGLLLTAWPTLFAGQDPPMPLPEVSTLISQGRAIERTQLDAAVQLYEKALALARERKHAPSEAHALLRIGDAIDSNQPLRAIDLLERSFAIFGELGDRARQGNCLVSLASAARQSSQHEKAFGYSTTLERLARDLKNNALLSDALNGLAGVYRERGQATRAIESYQEALTLLRGMEGRQSGVSTVLNNMAGTYADMANYRRAKEMFEESRAIAREINDPIAESLTLANLGNILTKMGETHQALEYLQQALPLNPDNRAFKAYCFHQIAIVYDLLGDLLKFFEYAQRGLAMKMAIPDPRSTALSYADISNFYEIVGQVDQAEECLKQGWRWIEGTDYNLGKIQILCKMGDFYLRHGRTGLVKDLLEKARAIAPLVESELVQIAIEGLHSDYLKATGRLLEARTAMEKALAVAVNSDEKRRELEFLASLGSIEVSLKRFPEARKRFDEAIEVARKIQYVEAEVDTLSRIAQLLEQQKQPTEASATYAKALTLAESSRESLGGLNEHKLGYQHLFTPIYQRYISLQLRAKRTETAFEWTQKAKARVLLDLMASGRVKVAQAMTTEDKVQEEKLSKRGKELTQQWLAAEGERDELKLDAKTTPERLKQAEARLLDIKRQQRALERESRDFHDQMYARNPRLAHQRAARTATLREVAAVLPDGAALLEYCVMARPGDTKEPDEIALFVVTRERGKPRLESFRYTSQRGSLARLSAELREACSARPGTSGERTYQGVSRQLYDILIAPAAKHIAGMKRLIVCPDGPLWDVPFQALLCPSSNPESTHRGGRIARIQNPKSEFLWERYSIAYGYSATGTKAALEVRGRPNRPRPQRSMLVMANPEFGSSDPKLAHPISPSEGEKSRGFFLRSGRLGNLPHTGVEADAIALAYPESTVRKKGGAQEALVKQEGARFRMLHFATHALVNDAAPMLSGVVLSRPPKDSKEDGILTVRELFSMNLSADMIVFSACETARGARKSGEGMIGLTWAAFAAGVPAQIVSQWSVDDEATANLMGRFYRELRKGKSKDTSLRTAALNLMGDGKHSHPFYWAPFLLVGDWR